MERNALIELFWKIHPKVYAWSNGRIGGAMMGLPVLLLTTTGRKSGLPRTKALMYLPYGENFVVIASNLGSDYHPAWWLNLQANPAAAVQVGGEQYPVLAREATGIERDEIWEALTDAAPAYDDYAVQTTRRIPVVVLERR
jgi:deazaflavin-dependent oxidoreductase (nitroreductase family)